MSLTLGFVAICPTGVVGSSDCCESWEADGASSERTESLGGTGVGEDGEDGEILS
jgi:hypothetical protein